jgi:hypothetical protein
MHLAHADNAEASIVGELPNQHADFRRADFDSSNVFSPRDHVTLPGVEMV